MGYCYWEHLGEQQDKSFAAGEQGLWLETLSLEKLTPGSTWNMAVLLYQLCSTSFALLLHLQQMFKHLGPCPLHVLPSTGTLEQQYLPMATRFGMGWLLYLCEVERCGHYSSVCSFRVYVQMLCKSCPVPCFLLWWGWRTRPAHARYCPMLWGGFLVSDMCLQVAKSCKRFYFCWTRHQPCCAALHGAGEGKDRRSVAAARGAWQALCPQGPAPLGKRGGGQAHMPAWYLQTATVSKPGMGQKLCASRPTMRGELCHSHLVLCQFRSLF